MSAITRSHLGCLAVCAVAAAGLAASSGAARAQAYDAPYGDNSAAASDVPPSAYGPRPSYQSPQPDPGYQGAYDQPRAYAPPADYQPQSAYDSAQPVAYGDDLIVRAPRRQQRDPATGAPIEWVSASRVVRYDDLDLSSGWGAHELKARVISAAHAACDELDTRFVVVNSDDRSCVRAAVREALYQTPIADGADD